MILRPMWSLWGWPFNSGQARDIAMLQIEISGGLEKAISAAIISGEFNSPEEYLMAAVRNFRVKKLNKALEEGYQDIENGNVLKVTNIDDFFQNLNREIEKEQHV